MAVLLLTTPLAVPVGTAAGAPAPCRRGGGGNFAAREGQLRSAGRLAAEFAHQIKNPLAIINNAAFSLQRAARDGKPRRPSNSNIIQEEVARADKVITQIMGYAQLSEGRVEKLEVVGEINRAIAQTFPSAMPARIKFTANSDTAFRRC